MQQQYSIYQNQGFYTTEDDLNRAIALAEELLGGVGEGEGATYTEKNNEGQLLAAITNQRIGGVFTKQKWGGRKEDEAEVVGRVPFDATDSILLMDHATLVNLQDYSESTDLVGLMHIHWNGPYEVQIVDSICQFFGVVDLVDITPEALAYAVNRRNPKPATVETISLLCEVELAVMPGCSVERFIEEMTSSIQSNTAGIIVTGTAIQKKI